MIVPALVTEVTPDWLQQAISVPVASPLRPERIGEGYGLSSEIYRIRWDSDSRPRSIVVKLWDIDGPAGTREIDFYRSFGPTVGTRIPGFHHGAYQEETRRGVLVLEDLISLIQGDCLDQLPLGGSTALARSLARLHRTWLGSPALQPLPSVMDVKRDRDWIEPRREEFLQRFGDRLDPRGRDLLMTIEDRLEEANGILRTAPETLLHADLHLDNVVFQGDMEHPVILDWARCARGPAALDLAQFLFTIGLPEDRERLLSAYLGENPIPDHRDQIEAALTRLFLTWTCGVVRWKPASPREERMIDVTIHRASAAVSRWPI